MRNPAGKLFAFTFISYALGCLVLAGYLAHRSPPAAPPWTFPHFTTATPLPDFSIFEQPQDRKEAFINTLLPLIEEKNEALLEARTLVLEMKHQIDMGEALTSSQIDILESLRERYHVNHDMYPDTAKAVEILLLRIDIIPPSMALAQAAMESGWGTSRFAAEAYNLFGQWCYTTGCGLVPERRAQGARHEVQAFASIEESIDAYYKNINTHSAYRHLRELRAQLREIDGGLTGSELVAGLEKYSARGQRYIDELRTIIRVNSLEEPLMVTAEITSPHAH